LFERPQSGERALLLHACAGHGPLPEDQQEFIALAQAAGVEVVGELSAALRRINPRFLIGTGKLSELKDMVASTSAEVVLVDHALSPAQERNLERELCKRVVDRSGLILDIFAQRARTHEGKLQVELAQLQHLSTRLVRGWTHLERQRGGIGLRGPGETQLETDRRLLAQRMRQLKSRLQRVVRQRAVAGRQRRKLEIPTVSIVGYTNAGKSTLFNQLTSAGVLAVDQLFATLDPTLRRVDLPDGTLVVLADTVGFVRDLPHELVAAFRSTLEETRDARLLLHVIDASDPSHLERAEDVIGVLEQIGAGEVPRLQVYNKADILGLPPRLDRGPDGLPERVWLSAQTGEGTDLLLAALSEHLREVMIRRTLRVGVAEARLRALLYGMGAVVAERALDEGGWELDVELDRRGCDELDRRAGLQLGKPSHEAAGLPAH
jgi:GTP-binding protein HflX